MDIETIRSFWNANPLYSGETNFEPGSLQFFEDHRQVYLGDCLAGRFDLRFLPPPRPRGQMLRILDLGCGVGFWTTEFGMRGFNHIVAVDLTPKALEITRKRMQAYGILAETFEENAEALSFNDNTFDHVNCQGVIHHTPNIDRAVSEIGRVLKSGGTACISVYYRNILLKLWPWLRWAGYPLAWLGGGLTGRGREGIFLQKNADEMVRHFDGKDNPLGKSFTKDQFTALLSPTFSIDEIFFHFFPARALPFSIPRKMHRCLDGYLPFMIYANVHKPCAE